MNSRAGDLNHTNEQLKWTADEIKTSIKTIEWDIQDLEDTIRIVEQNPSKFKLDGQEISRRKGFVKQSKTTIEAILKAVNEGQGRSINVQASPLSPSSAAATSSSGFKKPLESRVVNESPITNYRDDVIRDEHEQQMMVMRRQDDQLDGVLNTVTNMKNIALTINTELDDQAVLLRNLDDKVDTTQGRLKAAQTRLQNFMKQNLNDKTGWCILILSVIVIILLLMLLV